MAADAGGSKFLLITLLVATGILAYYYWDASTATSSLYMEVEKLSRQLIVSNKTITDKRLELEGCKAQLKVLEDEKNKLKTDSEAKDKQVAEKTAAEAKAQEEVKKITAEKAELDKQIAELKTKVDTCDKDCTEKVNKAKTECSAAANVKTTPAQTVAPPAPVPA